MIHLTRRMATKLIKDNINVTAIAPGAFKSDMNRAARDHSDEVAKRIPARRIGTDEDMAGVAIYLASRAGDYVVGNTIAVDGGVVYANAGLEIAGDRGRARWTVRSLAPRLRGEGWGEGLSPRGSRAQYPLTRIEVSIRPLSASGAR